MIRRVATGQLLDHHFLRQDKSGRWSHKDNDDPIRDVDDAGQKIGDLTQARFLNSPELVGFFLAKKTFLHLID